MKRQQGQGREGEVGQRYDVEHGVQRYWRSATYGSGQEQRRKGFRISITTIVHSELQAYLILSFGSGIFIYFLLRNNR